MPIKPVCKGQCVTTRMGFVFLKAGNAFESWLILCYILNVKSKLK